MNAPKCRDLDYINFLLAAQRVFSSVEAARTHPDGLEQPAHDAYTRLLQRLPPDSGPLWQEVEPLMDKTAGVLVLDDSTLDKPYAQHMSLVSHHWAGKHARVVKGINLISLVWVGQECTLPCDFRIYTREPDGKSKNDHFQDMLHQAHERGLHPQLVAFDSWYSGLPNLKLLRSLNWPWLTQLKGNRLISVDHSGNRPIKEVLIPSHGCRVHLKGYGWIKVFRTVAKNGRAEYWATSELEMSVEQAAFHALEAWQIEHYHRGLKQFTGIERGQYRLEVSQRNHIGLAIRAFVRLEVHRMQTGISWFEAKTGIIRAAMRSYLAEPTLALAPTA